MMSNEAAERKPKPRIVRLRRNATDSETALVHIFELKGWPIVHREFASAPVRYARPDIWAARPGELASIEVKSSISEETMVPCWQIAKVADFADKWLGVGLKPLPLVAAHLGVKKRKKWVFHLLSDEEVQMARRTVGLIRTQEKVWRAEGRKSAGKGKTLSEEAGKLVWAAMKRKDLEVLKPLGYEPSERYLFWYKIVRDGGSNWAPDGTGKAAAGPAGSAESSPKSEEDQPSPRVPVEPAEWG